MSSAMMPSSIMPTTISRAKNRKAIGEDDLPTAEIYKQAADVIEPWLEQIIGRLWETKVVPTDWRRAVTLPFFQ